MVWKGNKNNRDECVNGKCEINKYNNANVHNNVGNDRHQGNVNVNVKNEWNNK